MTKIKGPPFGGSFIFGRERGINQKRFGVFDPSGFAGKPLVSSCSAATCRTLNSGSRPSISNKYKKTAERRFFYIWRRERDYSGLPALRPSGHRFAMFKTAPGSFVEPEGSHQIICFPTNIKKPPKGGSFIFGGERGIRTLDTL